MLLKNYRGGQRVGQGNYWNVTTGELIRIEKEGLLPEAPEASYIKASPITLLILGPVGGLLYAVFLPFIGLFMLAALTTKKVLAGMKNLALTSASFGWRPLEAYLAGRKRKPLPRPKEKEGRKEDKN